MNKKTQIKNKTILEEAQELIYGDRAKAYGSAKENFNRTAAGWAVILGIPVTAEQIGLCMIWLKCCRQVNKPNRDNIVDICGYAGCIEKAEKGE